MTACDRCTSEQIATAALREALEKACSDLLDARAEVRDALAQRDRAFAERDTAQAVASGRLR